MQELLNHPAVQSGLAPFVAGLVVAVIFKRINLSGLALIAGKYLEATPQSLQKQGIPSIQSAS